MLMYGIIIFITIVIVAVRMNNRKHKKGIDEARLRGIKEALIEKRQYEALEKFEKDYSKAKPVESYQINEGKLGDK